MASMHDWLKGQEVPSGRVAIIHCKAGKGRSGTVACSYLISEEGWAAKDALTRFTSKRMRAGFGEGVSILSQQRWIRYVEWWARHNKVYVDRSIEILEIRVWGLRDGVKVAVESKSYALCLIWTVDPGVWSSLNLFKVSQPRFKFVLQV